MSPSPPFSPPGQTPAEGVAAPMSQRVAKGAVWTMSATVARIASTILTLPILTRLLTPEEFGLVQIAAPFLFLVMAFSDFGIQPALMVSEEPSRRLWSTAFWAGLVLTTLAMLMLMGAAPLIASYYNEPRAAPILQVLSVTLLIGGTMIVPGTWLIRSMKFQTLAMVEVFATTAGMVAAIAAAWVGWGVWSLVVQQLVMFSLKAIALCTVSKAPLRFEFSVADMKGILGAGWGMTNIRMVNYFSRNADILIVGRFLGATALGFYGIAWRVMTMPIEIFANSLFNVLIPAIGQMKNEPHRLKAALMKAYRTISLFTFPAMAGISALAMPLTIFAFGETFAPAAVPIAALAIHGALQSLVTIQGTVFMTLGRTDLMFRWAMISLGCIIGCLLIGVQWGLNGAALGYLLASLICSPLSMRAMMKLIGAQWGDLADAILVHSLLSILMGLLVFALTLILPDSWSALAVLAVCIPVGVLIYIGGLLAFDRKAIDDVLGTARSVLMKRAS